MLCSRVVSSEEFFGFRMSLGTEGESGWQFGCHESDHEHDQTAMVFGTLSQLTAREPRVLQYLGLPVGWSVSREADGFWVNPPDEQRSFKDEGSAEHEPWCRVGHHD